MTTFAFFDLDHTLLPFDTQALFCDFVLKRARWRTLRHLAFVPIAMLKACKLVSTVTAKRAFMGYLADMKRDTLLAYSNEFAEQAVKPWVYPELLATIEDHRKAGRVLVLNTASPDFYAKDIARVLGFDHCIATCVGVPERLPVWPVVIGKNNKHGAKIAAMKLAVPEVAAASDDALRNSWSYSDSSADLPLLEFAGNAVLVHPSASLAAIGKARGWQIIKPARPYSGKVGDMLSVVRQMLGIYPAP